MAIHNPHSSRLQYSLLSLCAVAIVVCFLAAYIGSIRRHAAAEQQVVELKAKNRAQAKEILVLKDRVGEIAVANPLKVHIRQLPTSGVWEREWKFRIYVPPEKHWRLCWSCGIIPARGFDVPYGSTGWSLLPPGQTDLEVFVRPTEDGLGAIVLRTNNSPLRISTQRTNFVSLLAERQLLRTWAI